MLTVLDFPISTKKTLHRRSKTITVLVNQQKKHQALHMKKKSLSQTKYNISTQPKTAPLYYKIKEPQKIQNTDSSSGIGKITQKIRKMINRELQYPQLLTYVNRGTCRLSSNQFEENHNTKNPEIQKNTIDRDTYFQMYKTNNETYKAGFRQPEYLALIKRTQLLNQKSFIPHFNWKQKLNKAKNMGNYGHIYKKKSSKTAFTKIVSTQDVQMKQNKLENGLFSNKLSIDPQETGFSKPQNNLTQAKKLSCRRCNTSANDYFTSQNQRRKANKTAYAQNFYSRKSSSLNHYHSLDKDKRQHTERQWKPEPWENSKEHNVYTGIGIQGTVGNR